MKEHIFLLLLSCTFLLTNCKKESAIQILSSKYNSNELIIDRVNENYLAVNYMRKIEARLWSSGTVLLQRNEENGFDLKRTFIDTIADEVFYNATLLTDEVMVYRKVQAELGRVTERQFFVYDMNADSVVRTLKGDEIAMAESGFFVNRSDTLFYYDKESPSANWKRVDVKVIEGNYNDGYILTYKDESICSLDIVSKDTLWQTVLGSPVSNYYKSRKSKTDIFINTESGLTVLDINTGSVKSVLNGFGIDSEVLEKDSLYFFYNHTSHDENIVRNITAMDKYTGEVIWISSEGANANDIPVLFEDKVISFGDYIDVIDVSTGKLLTKNDFCANHGILTKEYLIYKGASGAVYQKKLDEILAP